MSENRENSRLGRAWHSHVVGRDDTAVEAFQEITETQPNDLDALYGLALAQKGAGQHDQALTNFKRILSLLGKINVTEADANRVEMLTRMVNQQIAFLEKKE